MAPDDALKAAVGAISLLLGLVGWLTVHAFNQVLERLGGLETKLDALATARSSNGEAIAELRASLTAEREARRGLEAKVDHLRELMNRLVHRGEEVDEP